MNRSLLQTHTYDGKLKNVKQVLQQDISRASQVSKKEKLQAFVNLRLNLTLYKEFTPKVKRCFDAIYNTFSQSGRVKTSRNYDCTNDVYADDLLFLCYEKVFIEKDSDFARMLILQLEDMNTGLCPQGRTTRLLQILLIFKNSTSRLEITTDDINKRSCLQLSN
jgi:hypothetical protein